MDDQQEFQVRRTALRLWAKGVQSKVILGRVHRSRAWLTKWRGRYQRWGLDGLKSQSRRPAHSPTACSRRVERLIVQTRRRLAWQKVGLVGPRAIRRELKKLRLGRRTPSLSTIKRVLRRYGLTRPAKTPRPAYFPAPRDNLRGSLHALDWTCRYLTDGPKVYAFHTLNLHTRAIWQTITLDKSTPTVIAHLLATWKTLGIPDFLQLDNDAAFCGGYKVPRVFGQVVRLCLYVGVELVFLPVAEPERNGEVEQLNHLWSYAFWERRHFHSFAQVQRASPEFVRWYMTDYAPPALAEQTPRAAQRTEPRRRLTASQAAHLATPLPITAGRVHFIRKVQLDGTIALFNESWRVGKRLAGKYVWATIITHQRRLDVWYQRSTQTDWQLLKSFVYDISETIARRKPEFARR